MMLSPLIWLPLIGALVIGLVPNLSEKQARTSAIAVSSTILLWTIVLMFNFNLSIPGFQMQEYHTWIPTLGISYSLAVDGLSLPLLALGSLITTLVAFSGTFGLKTGEVLQRPRLFYSMLLIVNAGVAGAFLAQNLLLFFLFYELELVPFYLLILIWGGQKREYAAMKFLIYTAISGILILSGFLGVTWLSHAASFDYADINVSALPQNTQLILLTVLLVGFGIKTPLVPLHTWLPDTYVEASTPVAILLGGILAKLGTYGLVRFCLGLFPETWQLVSPGLSIIAAVSILYGALSALAQHDIKRMVAFSSIAHMGYVLLGAAALTPLAMVGAVSQMIAHGLILALLFYLVGLVEAKTGTRDRDILNGLLNPIRGLPLTSALLILAAMASAGIPGLAGFVAEFLVFQGSFARFPLPTLIAILGTGLTAVYFVILLNRTCFGKLDNKTAYFPKVKFIEYVPALALTALIFWLGVQPTWLVRWSEQTTKALVTAAVPQVEQVAFNSVDRS
jgi:NAD(P)H-quinone oxidoreductase subunit 4